MGAGPLLCPRCASTHPLTERFCPDCHMPLIYAGARSEGPVTERHARARKIRPQYADGPLVRAAWARNQAEAELLAGMLLEEGIPSMIKRAPGFDVPDFLAAGPRHVLVPASGAQAARDLLGAQDADQASVAARAGVEPAALAAGILVAVAIVALLAWLVAS